MVEFPAEVDLRDVGDVNSWKAIAHDREASRSMRKVEIRLSIKSAYTFKVAYEIISEGCE